MAAITTIYKMITMTPLLKIETCEKNENQVP